VISDIFIDQEPNETFLIVQNENGTKVSAPLKSPDFEVDFGEEAINNIKLILDRWGEKRKRIAEFYIKEKREIHSFVYDLLALAHFTSRLRIEHDRLLGRWNPTDLLHDRLVAQLVHELSSLGYEVETKVSGTLGIKNHDFNASLFRCEVKSLRIQIDAPFILRGVWIDSRSRERMSQRMRQEFFNARNQVGRDGIIFMTPLSSNVNALFRGYFKDKILYHVPPPAQGGTVVLVLSTQAAFRDCYLSIPMVHFLIAIEQVISDSHAFGLRSFSMFSRWPFRLTTAPVKGSTVGFSPRGN
jgi:hypothetical protein